MTCCKLIILTRSIILMKFIPMNWRSRRQQRATDILRTMIYSSYVDNNDHQNTWLYDKCDDFNFNITNFLFLNSNNLSLLAYDHFVTQPIRYTKTCLIYSMTVLQTRWLVSNIHIQVCVIECLRYIFADSEGHFCRVFGLAVLYLIFAGFSGWQCFLAEFCWLFWA